MSVRPHPKQQTDSRYRSTWIIDYRRPNGARAQEVFDGPEVEALKVEQSFRIRTKKPELKTFPSLLEVVPMFRQAYQLEHQPSGVKRVFQTLQRLMRFFGRYQFQSITKPLVEGYKRGRIADGIKPATVNIELSALSSMVKWAVDQGYCEAIHIRRFPAKMCRSPIWDIPTRKEVVKILRSLPRDKRAAFAVMYYLGFRSQEARDLLPEMVRWSAGIIVIRGKGFKERIVPINKKAAPYLRNSLPLYSPASYQPTINWACKRIGLKRRITPHIFRHAFGCHCVASGVHTRALQQIMGHASISTTERYSQVMADTLIREMAKF